jgi:fucose 4-O-acetylase-like acetyltransferase
MNKPRHAYIDRTKGLAILLVVIGHLVAREMAPGGGGQWYGLLKDRLYAFHMPLFMAVSGLVYGLTWRPAPDAAADLRDSGRRIVRLLPSYLLFGLLIFFGKLAFQVLMPGSVDNPVNGPQALLDLLLRPGISFTSFLWYVYALSLLYLLFPPAFRLARGHMALLIAVAAVFWLLPSGDWLTWDRLQYFTIFFLVGVLAGRHHDATLRVLTVAWLPALLGFAVLLPLADKASPALRWALAALSIVALPGLLRATERLPLGWLEELGRYTLIIYLTNTIFIGLTKIAAIRLHAWHTDYLVPVFVVMTLLATIGPILLKRHVLPRVPALDRITS